MSRTKRKAAAAKFVEHIRRSNELHAGYIADPRQLEDYERFANWQMARLLAFFSDLHARPGYSEAIDFVVSDLAGVGISQRDRDLERAAPIITRMLPLQALETVAVAAELNERVLDTNLAIVRHLAAKSGLPEHFNEVDYCLAFRQASSIDECTQMVSVVTELGDTLQTLVRIRLLGSMLRAMRAPAQAAGFGALHDFLRTGYETFREIPDIRLFLTEIEARMNEVFRLIFLTPRDELEAMGQWSVESLARTMVERRKTAG